GGRWVLAGQSRYGDGFPADDAGGLCAGVREDGRRRKVRDGQRTIHSSTPSSKGPAERCTRLRGELSRGVSGWRDRVSQSIFDSFWKSRPTLGVRRQASQSP